MRSTITSWAFPPQLRGSGRTVWRHTLRVWKLPEFTPVAEFATGELGCCPRAAWAMAGPPL